MPVNWDKLPPRVLTRVFEHLFWAGLSGTNGPEQLVLPLGHRLILPCLHASHAWRKRAAGLFYRTAVVAAGANDMVLTLSGPQQVCTNIRLVLESGYAPKTTRLLLLSGRGVQPEELVACLVASEFVGFAWPAIAEFYFYHPGIPPIHSLEPERDQDMAIDDANHYLAAAMPNLTRICALSGTCDSFGLFALDDLIDARMPDLDELQVVAQSPLHLGFHGEARVIRRLTMHTTIHNTSRTRPPSLLHGSSSGGASGYSTDVSSDGSLRSHGSGDANGTVHTLERPPISMPRVHVDGLVSLDIGPIAPDSIWAPFFGAAEQPQVFLSLRRLGLLFARGPAKGGSSRRARRAHRRRASLGLGNEVFNGIYPQFPRLEALRVEGYPYDLVLFLESFPRAQLRHLEIRRCPGRFFQLALSEFPSLMTAKIEIPEAAHARREEDEEDWVSRVLAAPMPELRELALRAQSISSDINLPKQCALARLQTLDLHLGMRSVEMEKLLGELPSLRVLRVVFTEVLGRTHEYLSRKVRRKKYPKGEHRHRHNAQLSSPLEELTVQLIDLSPARKRRALAKTAWAAARMPSLLLIRTQGEHIQDLSHAIAKVLANKSAPIDTHLRRAILSSLQKVPGPWLNQVTSLPLQYHIFRGKYHEYAMLLHDQYGEVVRLGYNQVSVANVSELRRILATHRFCKGASYERGLFLPPSTFSTTDPELNKTRRRQLGPAYSMPAVRELEDTVIQHGVAALMRVWDQRIAEASSAREKRPVALVNYFYGFHSIAFDIIGELGFGRSFGLLESGDTRIVDALHKLLMFVIAKSVIPALGYAPWIAGDLDKGRKYVVTVATEAIAQRKRQSNQRHGAGADILQRLIDAHDPGTGKRIEDGELTAEIMLLLVAGTDTSSNTLAWTLMHLLHHPPVLDRLQRQIREAFPDPGRHILFDEARRELPYLTAVFYESMRLHPAVSGYLPRAVPAEGAELLNRYRLPGGSIVCVSLGPCHRNPRTWPQPQRFDPERFMGPAGSERMKDVLAFGNGARMCAGRNLAWMELYTVLANLLRRYNFALPRDAPYGPHRGPQGVQGSGCEAAEPQAIPGRTYTTFGPDCPRRNCLVEITPAN
ncbi:hypothetical protein GGF46_003239 [Coemansia sp. RSA 552]|nr:hypothetical protein GGF46_003239 [Coemansia sp. RSA 552]